MGYVDFFLARWSVSFCGFFFFCILLFLSICVCILELEIYMCVRVGRIMKDVDIGLWEYELYMRTI